MRYVLPLEVPAHLKSACADLLAGMVEANAGPRDSDSVYFCSDAEQVEVLHLLEKEGCPCGFLFGPLVVGGVLVLMSRAWSS
eukprot:11872780-Alexandrium_andersonii.AAC.1